MMWNKTLFGRILNKNNNQVVGIPLILRNADITLVKCPFFKFLPPFSLIRDFRKQNTRGNVSKISVNHTRQYGMTCMIDGNFGNISAGVESRVSTKTVVHILNLKVALKGHFLC